MDNGVTIRGGTRDEGPGQERFDSHVSARSLVDGDRGPRWGQSSRAHTDCARPGFGATRPKQRGRLRATTARTPIPFPRGRDDAKPRRPRGRAGSHGKRPLPQPGDSRARGLDAAHRGAEHASQRADVDSLARPVAARRYGWRPGRLRFSHRAQAGLRLRVSTAPERHVLVSFALAIAGTDRDGRPVRDRARDEPLRVDHDAVILLGDWLHQSPYAALAALRKGPAKPMAAKANMADMKPDLADIEYDAFLLNGRATQDPWTYSARPAERIRLRIINAAASTYFRLALDGHPLTITHADGLAVEPVTVDHLQMGMAEIYDVVVTLSGSGSYTLHAAAIDGSGQAIGVLHTPDAAAKANLAMPTFEGRALSYGDLRAVAPT